MDLRCKLVGNTDVIIDRQTQNRECGQKFLTLSFFASEALAQFLS
jgi:hypothetical protein